MPSDLKKRNSKCEISYVELMTMLILFNETHYNNFKQFYYEYVSNGLNEVFTSLVNYDNFIKLQKSILIFFCYLLKTLTEKKPEFILSTQNL